MAYSDISLLGATYPTVPSILLPKSGGGNVQFYDVSQETTAAESDVASGKKFFKADGSVGTGTASGGGGSIKEIVIRPDAELAKLWSGDDLLVEDLQRTLPAYSTTAKSALSSASLATTYTMDWSYDWLCVEKCLVYPIYTTQEWAIAKPVYHITIKIQEIINVPAGTITCDGKSLSGDLKSTMSGTYYLYVYRQTNAALSTLTGSGATYGAYATGLSSSYSYDTFTAKAPGVSMRGSGSYFSSSVWSTVTDVRRQYRVELYRAPRNLSYDGWIFNQTALHIINDAQGTGTLT